MKKIIFLLILVKNIYPLIYNSSGVSTRFSNTDISRYINTSLLLKFSLITELSEHQQPSKLCIGNLTRDGNVIFPESCLTYQDEEDPAVDFNRVSISKFSDFNSIFSKKMKVLDFDSSSDSGFILSKFNYGSTKYVKANFNYQSEENNRKKILDNVKSDNFKNVITKKTFGKFFESSCLKEYDYDKCSDFAIPTTQEVSDLTSIKHKKKWRFFLLTYIIVKSKKYYLNELDKVTYDNVDKTYYTQKNNTIANSPLGGALIICTNNLVHCGLIGYLSFIGDQFIFFDSILEYKGIDNLDNEFDDSESLRSRGNSSLEDSLSSSSDNSNDDSSITSSLVESTSPSDFEYRTKSKSNASNKSILDDTPRLDTVESIKNSNLEHSGTESTMSK